MTAFISSVFGVFEILILIIIGYFLTARGWFNSHSSKVIAKVVTRCIARLYDRHHLIEVHCGYAFALVTGFVLPGVIHDDPFRLVISGLLLVESTKVAKRHL